jgi:hypothetical protein
MKFLPRLASMTLVLLAFASISSVSWAQSCPSLVQSAIEAIAQNCTQLGRNTACYGYNLVSAEFAVEVEEDTFSKPADQIGIASLQKIQTARLDLTTEQWGVGVLSLQANIPNTLPGQAVTMILVGDAELENAVLPEDSFSPSDGISVTTNTNVNIRSGAGLRNNVIAVASAGEALIADGLSSDGDWVRVAYSNRIGWVNIGVVTATGGANLRDLPTLDGTQRMPMQAFFLRTGIGAPECEEATNNLLLVQGPKNIKVDLTINGAEMQIGSTVLYRILSDDQMEIVVIDGEARIIGGGADGQDLIVREGFRSVVCLGAPENLGADGQPNDQYVSCPFSEPEEVPLEELGGYCVLEAISPDALNYPIDLPCEETFEEYLAKRATPEPPAPVVPTAPPAGSCASFTTLAPTDAIINGLNGFSWTTVNGADSYSLNFADGGGNYIGGQLFGNVSSATFDTVPLPHGGTLKWDVSAVRNGQVLCQTAQRTLNVLQPVAPPPVELSSAQATPEPLFFDVVFSCTATDGEMLISWFNAEAGDTIIMFDIKVNSVLDASGFDIGTGAIGAYTYNFGATYECFSNPGVPLEISSSGAVTSPSGKTTPITPIFCTCP